MGISLPGDLRPPEVRDALVDITIKKKIFIFTIIIISYFVIIAAGLIGSFSFSHSLPTFFSSIAMFALHVFLASKIRKEIKEKTEYNDKLVQIQNRIYSYMQQSKEDRFEDVQKSLEDLGLSYQLLLDKQRILVEQSENAKKQHDNLKTNQQRLLDEKHIIEEKAGRTENSLQNLRQEHTLLLQKHSTVEVKLESAEKLLKELSEEHNRLLDGHSTVTGKLENTEQLLEDLGRDHQSLLNEYLNHFGVFSLSNQKVNTLGKEEAKMQRMPGDKLHMRNRFSI